MREDIRSRLRDTQNRRSFPRAAEGGRAAKRIMPPESRAVRGEPGAAREAAKAGKISRNPSQQVQDLSAGKRVYGGGRPMPNIGRSNPVGYAERDRKTAASKQSRIEAQRNAMRNRISALRKEEK